MKKLVAVSYSIPVKKSAKKIRKNTIQNLKFGSLEDVQSSAISPRRQKKHNLLSRHGSGDNRILRTSNPIVEIIDLRSDRQEQKSLSVWLAPPSEEVLKTLASSNPPLLRRLMALQNAFPPMLYEGALATLEEWDINQTVSEFESPNMPRTATVKNPKIKRRTTISMAGLPKGSVYFYLLMVKNKGKGWEELLSEFLFNASDRGNKTLRAENMKTLLLERQRYIGWLIGKAVSELVGNQFNLSMIKISHMVHPTKKDFQNLPQIMGYKVQFSGQEGLCEVTFKAPGSMELTSDIDFCVKVKGVKHLPQNLLKAYQGKDPEIAFLSDLLASIHIVSRQTFKTNTIHAFDVCFYQSGFLNIDYLAKLKSTDYESRYNQTERAAALAYVLVAMSWDKNDWKGILDQITTSFCETLSSDKELAGKWLDTMSQEAIDLADTYLKPFQAVFISSPEHENFYDKSITCYFKEIRKLSELIEKVKETSSAETIYTVYRQTVICQLFAPEGYWNQSAVLHVVKGMQMGSQVDLGPFVCASFVQQIGCRIWHSPKNLEGQNLNLYAPSKYGYRMSHLLKKGQVLLPFLTDLSNEDRTDLGQKLPKHSAEILAGDIKMMNTVKKDPTVAYCRKPEEAVILLKERLSTIDPISEFDYASLQNTELKALLGLIGWMFAADWRNAKD